jgi:iron complex outermembrane receptor protein
VSQGVPSAVIGSYQFPTTATGQVVAGNIGLTPERATTYNLGFVFNAPRGSGLLGDFSISVDYYNIKIKDVISAVPGLTVLSKCFNLDGSNPSYSNANSYCSLISRDTSTGQILNVSTPYLNLGQLQTSGVEAQVHWGVPADFLASSGKLYIDTAVGWLNSYKVQLLPGAAFLDYTGVSVGGAGPGAVPPRATPEWKALTTFGYRSDALGVGLRWRYQSGMKDNSSVLTPNTASVGVGAYATWDMFANYKLTKAVELRGGVTNLFNKSLPFVASSQNGTDTALYDAIGRSFYVGIKAGF